MQLNPGERSILAYFSDDQQANAAAQELKQCGFQDLQVDGISRYPSRPVSNTTPSTLSSMVLGSMEFGSKEFNRSHDPLLAADPSVSGMSSRQEQVAGYSYLLTLVTSNDRIAEAVDIVKKYGALV